MRLSLETTPTELEAKGEQLIRALMDAVSPLSPELAESLEKSLPEKAPSLKYRALRDIHNQTKEAYRGTLAKMTEAIGKVLTRAGQAPSFEVLAKSEKAATGGPFIGPRGGKWADAQHTIPWEDPSAASHNGTFRYGAALRPVVSYNVPKGAQHEPHADFRHGQAVYDRPLTADEITSYELTPILNDRATEERVNRTLDELHEYADEYRNLLEEDPKLVETTIRQSLERQGPANYDIKAAVQRVLEGLKGPAKNESLVDPKLGDALTVKLHPKTFRGREPVTYYVGKVTGDKVQLTSHKDSVGGEHVFGPTMPKASLHHFVNDLEGRVELPPSGNPDIDAVTSGKAEFLGKGDDGLAFRVGDKVVKVSTTVPFQPDNPGHRSPEQASEMLRKQVEVGNHLAGLGIAGIQHSEFVQHGDKGFQIKPWVEIPEKFTSEQLDKIQDTLIAIHKAGYALHDDVQAGLDEKGNPVMYDVGKTSPIEIAEGEGLFTDVGDDMDRLRRLYETADVPFFRKDVDEGQQAWDKAVAIAERAHKAGGKGKRGYVKKHLDLAAKKRKEVAHAKFKGKALADELDQIDLEHEFELAPFPEETEETEETAKKSLDSGDLAKAQGGPYIGPRGGKWADPEHTIPWEEGGGGGTPQGTPQPEEAQAQPPAPPVNLEAIRANYEAQNEHAQQRRYFTDRNTGLLNARGAEAQPHDPARPMTARFSMEGFKAFNDQFGHEIPDGALRHMAAALSQHMQDGVKRGGDIEGDVRDQAHADEIAESMSRAIDPQGRLRVVATAVPRGEDHAKTLEALGTAHKARKDAEVAAGKLGHRLKVPVAFAGHPKPEEAMKPLAEGMSAAPMGDHAQLSAHHVAEFQKVGAAPAFKTSHLEDSGLLTEDGFHHSMELNPDHHVASADMRGLNVINEAFGRKAADLILQEFTKLIAKNGGGNFNAAHPHGDEILAHHADPAQLQAFFSDLKSATDNVVFFMEKKTGDKLEYVVQKGLHFVHGVGRDLDEADRVDLAKNKQAQGDIKPPETLGEDDAARALDGFGAQGLRLVNLGTSPARGVRPSQGSERSKPPADTAPAQQVAKSLDSGDLTKAQGGPYVGPRGGKWADPEHTIHWEEGGGGNSEAIADDLHENAHPAVQAEVKPAAVRAVAVGADAASLKYVGAGAEGIIFSDKTGRAYRVLRTNDPYQRAEKVRVEQEAVESLKGTPAEKYMAPHFHADPEQGVIVRSMIEGRPGGWGTQGLREAYDTIAAELKKQDFSSPEYKEDSFILPEGGGPPIMVDIGFLYPRGKREAKQVTETVERGDPTAIDLLDQPFAIRNLYYDGNMSLEDALRLTSKIKDMKPGWSEHDYKDHLSTLEYTAKQKGDVAPTPKAEEAHFEPGTPGQFILKQGREEVGEVVIKPRKGGHLEVANILVWPKFQRKGMGTKLYEKAFQEAQAQGKKLFISAEPSADAQAVHAKFRSQGKLKPSGELVLGSVPAKPKPKRTKKSDLKSPEEVRRARVLMDGYSSDVIASDHKLEQAEAAIRLQPIEHCAVFGDDGVLLSRIEGVAGSAKISASVARQIRENGNVTLTHNHPNGSCFSIEDILVTVGLDLKEMRAVTASGRTYILTRPTKGWDENIDTTEDSRGSVKWVRAASTIFAENYDAARSEVWDRVQAAGGARGDSSHPAFSLEGWNEAVREAGEHVVAQLAKQWGWGFRVERGGGGEGPSAPKPESNTAIRDQSRRKRASVPRERRSNAAVTPGQAEAQPSPVLNPGAEYGLAPVAPPTSPGKKKKRTPVAATKQMDLFRSLEPGTEPVVDHTLVIAQQAGVAYRRVRQAMRQKGYTEADFEPGGQWFGASVNKLLERLHGVNKLESSLRPALE
jgi:GGDEF domain-containing protein/GNAT superfamily N-acetyltransferase